MKNPLSEYLENILKEDFFIRAIYERFDNSCCQNFITCISSGSQVPDTL